MGRKLITLLIGAAAVAAMPAQAGQRLSPEEKLARVVAGRVAGEPVECINLRQVRNSQVIDNTALVFDTGNVIYVNRPRAGAEALGSMDIQVVRPGIGRLCSVDTVDMVDRTTLSPNGIVFLGQFVPYRRVRD